MLEYCTQEGVLSQRMFISEIQPPSNYLHVHPQVVPTTVNESTYTCPFTDNKEEWRLGSHVDMKKKNTGQLSSVTGYA